jgi:hypothetical protein
MLCALLQRQALLRSILLHVQSMPYICFTHALLLTAASPACTNVNIQ